MLMQMFNTVRGLTIEVLQVLLVGVVHYQRSYFLNMLVQRVLFLLQGLLLLVGRVNEGVILCS
jgi:hypothetical protein